MRVRNAVFVLVSVVMATAGGAMAQMLDGATLVAALRKGGHVIVMRHASSPGQPPVGAALHRDNVGGERQLDEAGRAAATAMGEALRRLQIPIGEVLTSPAFRARETARYAGLANARAYDELGDGGQSMKQADDARGAWLRRKAGESPRAGNTLIVTHQPNVARAFPDAANVAEGEALVFAPDGKGSWRLVARVPIDRWTRLR